MTESAADSGQGEQVVESSLEDPPDNQPIPPLLVAGPWLRSTLYALGVLLPAAVIADWLTDFDFVTSGDDPMFATIVFTLAIVLWLAPGAFDAASNAYERIWLRGVIHAVDDESDEGRLGAKLLARAPGSTPRARYRGFIEGFNARANSRWMWLASGLFFAAAYVVFWQEVVRDTSETSLIWFDAYADLNGSTALVVVLGQLVLWGLVGVVAWKVFWIAWETARLSKSFFFEVVVGHPDKSGGLAVLGHACFRLALIVSVPSILVAFWVVVLDRGVASSLFRARYAAWDTNFRVGLAILIVLTFLVAVRPLRGVHKGMKRGRNEIQIWLDEIAVQLNRRTRSLLEEAPDLDNEAIAARTKEIESDQDLISELGRFPTWPFDRATIAKLSAVQVVPVLSMLGITGPIADFVQGLFSFVGG